MHLWNGPSVVGSLEMSNTYHNTCTRATAKVQFSVDVSQVISHWADGAVERDYNVVLIQQLKRKFSCRSAARPGGNMRHDCGGRHTTKSLCAL